MKYKFNVGDKVVVNFCTDEIPDMLMLVGKTVTICSQFEARWDALYPAYHIEEDSHEWCWREDWLESAEYAPKGDILPVSEDELLDMFGE